jgi:hypothetical protein
MLSSIAAIARRTQREAAALHERLLDCTQKLVDREGLLQQSTHGDDIRNRVL